MDITLDSSGSMFSPKPLVVASKVEGGISDSGCSTQTQDSTVSDKKMTRGEIAPDGRKGEASGEGRASAGKKNARARPPISKGARSIKRQSRPRSANNEALISQVLNNEVAKISGERDAARELQSVAEEDSDDEPCVKLSEIEQEDEDAILEDAQQALLGNTFTQHMSTDRLETFSHLGLVCFISFCIAIICAAGYWDYDEWWLHSDTYNTFRANLLWILVLPLKFIQPIREYFFPESWTGTCFRVLADIRSSLSEMGEVAQDPLGYYLYRYLEFHNSDDFFCFSWFWVTLSSLTFVVLFTFWLLLRRTVIQTWMTYDFTDAVITPGAVKDRRTDTNSLLKLKYRSLLTSPKVRIYSKVCTRTAPHFVDVALTGVHFLWCWCAGETPVSDLSTPRYMRINPTICVETTMQALGPHSVHLKQSLASAHIRAVCSRICTVNLDKTVSLRGDSVSLNSASFAEFLLIYSTGKMRKYDFSQLLFD